jgi:hypothetical protein
MEACAQDAERVLGDDHTPPAAKPFLRDLIDKFKEGANRERLSEENESVN